MNNNSVQFIRQHWQLLYHSSAKDFEPLIQQTVLQSVCLIIHELEKEEWRTISEIADATGLHSITVSQITSALKGELFDKFPCPLERRGHEVAIALLSKRRLQF